jgi:hypothetical protein
VYGCKCSGMCVKLPVFCNSSPTIAIAATI